MKFGSFKREDYIKIFNFEVFHKKWEMDSQGWIVEDKNGKRHILLTSHNIPYLAKISELKKYISQYEMAAKNMKQAIEILNE